MFIKAISQWSIPSSETLKEAISNPKFVTYKNISLNEGESLNLFLYIEVSTIIKLLSLIKSIPPFITSSSCPSTSIFIP